jgi:hypothetical protein
VRKTALYSGQLPAASWPPSHQVNTDQELKEKSRFSTEITKITEVDIHMPIPPKFLDLLTSVFSVLSVDIFLFKTSTQ